ncbi:MAG: LacI family transcriptional regulator [Actinomycetota bacterium]|nr:LacI family transcriptional regulator [Actinomycetota bacterium]
MTTIRQVAQRVGVSPSTVSRVLTGASPVAPPYRDRVLRAAAELGYRPNRLASRLRRKTSETVGVVVSAIENPHYTQMVRTVENVAYQEGFRVLLCNTDEASEKQEAYLDVLTAERVGGVILVPSDPASALIGDVLDMGIPLVAFDRMVVDPRADAVLADNADGTRRATKHLLEAGHERIGFVSGLPGIQTGAERLGGYEAAMREHNLDPLSAFRGFRIDQAGPATERLLDADRGISALIVANNLMTIGALRAVRQRGMGVPEDLSLVAIDDPPWAVLVDPPLTVLAQPVHRMAERAADLLFERIKGSRAQASRVVFPFELRVRGSCGSRASPPDSTPR